MLPEYPAVGDTVFRIISANPANRKLMRVSAGAGRRLLRSQVAVTIHRVGHHGTVDSMPTSTCDDCAENVSLLRLEEDAAVLEDSLLGWRKSSGLVFSLRGMPQVEGVDNAAMSTVVTDIVLSQQAPSRYVPPNAVSQRVLDFLSEAGVVECCHDSWRLTGLGMQRLSHGLKLERPFKVCQRREVPIADMTTYELIVLLRERGWVWNLWVPKSKRPAHLVLPEAYVPGSAKVWFSPGISVVWPYLAVLAQVDELASQGLPRVPHAREVALYNKILRGDFRLEPAPPRLCHALVDDVEEPGEPPLPLPLPPTSSTEGTSDSSDSSDSEESESAEGAGESAEAESEAKENEPVSESECDASESSEESVEMPQPPPPAPVGPPAAAGLFTQHFGVFRLSPKLPTADYPFGGYVANCVLHRKNRLTGCQKFCRIQAQGPGAHADCIRRLKYWCTLAVVHNRQRRHLRHFPELDECPPQDVIDANVITERPDGRVKTDDELDNEAVDSE